MTALLGRKIGMTRWFTADGRNHPVTVIEAGPCAVTQVKTTKTDGYSAIQIGFDEVRPKRSTMPIIGHDGKAGAAPQRFHREERVKDDDVAARHAPGQVLDVSVFAKIKYVDVIGTSKGKGFAGVMKRHGFGGQCASHGTERKHRSPGSISAVASMRGQGPIKKGIRMAGRMGGKRITVRNLDVIAIDPAKNLLIVKGLVPGPAQGLVVVRESVRLYKSKARKAREAAAAKSE
jgi:large subunit ribosomal protein L3